MHKINFLYFSGKISVTAFGHLDFFFFLIQGLTGNGKTDSNKKYTELEDIGNLSCKILKNV